MYVEIAEIDIDNMRSTVHSIDGVVAFDHERECPENDYTATMHITLENGSKTITGRGYGLETVKVEQT